MYGGDEVSAIVLDLGSYTCKAGYAGEDAPKAVFRSVVGAIDQSGVGDVKSEKESDSMLDPKSAIKTLDSEQSKVNQKLYVGSQALGYRKDHMEILSNLCESSTAQVMDELNTSDAVNLSTAERNVVTSSYNRLSNDHNGDDLWDDDASDLDREWHKRHDQFHKIGYRDGIIAGKEASAEEGFNNGFKQSVLVGYKWGLVRGVTSVLSCLPTELKEKLAETVETKDGLQNLRESVCSISTKDAFQIFYEEILGNESSKQYQDFEGNLNISGEQSAVPSCNQMGRHIQVFELLMESSAVRLHKME